MAGSGLGSGYVGREAELERLGRRLEQAVGGQGGIVILRGPSGVGVTRTAYECAARADRLGMVTLWGQMVDGLAGRPFGGVADALEEFGTSLPAATLRQQLAGGAPALSRVCPRLREVMPNIPPAAPLEAADERLRLHDSVVGWLRRATADTALLLIIDDWQWADDDTRDLLDHVAAAATTLPFLVLLTESLLPGAKPPTVSQQGVVAEIEGLDDGALATVIGELGDRPIPRETLAAIHEVTGGHPLFAGELVRHLAEEDRLYAAQPPSAAELPVSYEAVIAWRVSRLPLETRTMLNALACFPAGATPALLAEVTGMARARLVEITERAVSAGMVRLAEHGQHYALYHDRLRHSLSSSTPARVRAAVHRRAAGALEEELAEDVRAHATELVDHLIAAAQAEPASAADPRAVRHLLVATEQARAAYAHRRAALLLGHALTAFGEGRQTDYVELAARQAVAQAEAGQTAAAVESVAGLLAGQRRHGLLTREAWSDVVTATRTIRYGASVSTAASVARTALEQGNPRDELLRSRLRLLAEEWVPREAGGLQTLIWRADETDARSILAAKGDDADRADAYIVQKERTPAESGQLTIAVAGWHRPAAALRGFRAATTDLIVRLGQFRAGAGMASRYLASAERFGSLPDVAGALLLLSRARAALGDLAAASEIVAAADAVLARIGHSAELEEDRLLAELALMHSIDGDWAAAIRRVDAVLAAGPSEHALELVSAAALGNGRLVRQGEARAGVATVIVAAAEIPPLTLGRDAALFDALSAAWELGAAEFAHDGRALLDRAVPAGAGGSHSASPRLAIARLLALSGNVADAREQFAKERPRLEAAGLRPLRAILDYDEAIAIAASGTGHAEAGTLLERAFAGFHGLGMTGWARRAEELQASGFEAAIQPGGRLHFSYPAGLTRREVDVVRLVTGGQTPDQAADALELERAVVERHLASAMEKLGAATTDDLPRLARRHGLGGGA